MPPGGPWDEELARRLRAVVGAGDDAPVLELLRASVARWRLDAPRRLCVAGSAGVCSAEGRPIPWNTVVNLPGGVEIEVRRIGFGATLIALGPPDGAAPFPVNFGLALGGDVHVLPGPNASLFDPAGEWPVSWVGDRVGLRLEGVGPPHGLELPSMPSVPGAIQLTPAGDLLIVGPDGPTIGGYPVVGVVTRADFRLLAYAGPLLCLRPAIPRPESA